MSDPSSSSFSSEEFCDDGTPSFSRYASQSQRSTFPSNTTSSEEVQLTINDRINEYIYRLQQDDDLSIESFNMDLHLIATDDPEFVNFLLCRLEQHENETKWQHGPIVPNSASYHCIIDGWYNIQRQNKNRQHRQSYDAFASDSAFDSAQARIPALEAQKVLDRMERPSSGQKMVSPNSLSYLQVCEMWATMRPASVENVERAEVILNKYLQQMLNTKARTVEPQRHRSRKRRKHYYPFDSSELSFPPKYGVNDTLSPPMHLPASAVQMYSFVIDGWCRLIERVPEAMDRIEGLLEEIESNGGSRIDQYRDNTVGNHPVVGIRPNVVIYTSIITALSKTKVPDMARRADNLLERMKNHGIQPDLVAYTAVLNCWSKAVSRTERNLASKRAIELLREVENAYLKRQLDKPSPITYGKAIMSIARSFDKDAPKIAESILREMTDGTNSITVQPTTACWNAVIYAMGSVTGHAEHAEALLHEMIRRSSGDGEDSIRPNIKTWGGVIRAYAESGASDSGQKAQKVVEWLEHNYAEQAVDVEDDIQVKPNCVCYSTVLNAWARGSAPQNITLRAVDEILRKMESSLDIDIRPNCITYKIAMDAYCRHDTVNCGIRSHKLVDRMIKLYAEGDGFDRVKPTVMIMNTLINAWSQSDHPHATRNAETVFRWMESQFASGDETLKPDEISLCNVLNAYANRAQNGGAARAQQIIDHIEMAASPDRGRIMSLTVQHYNVLIKAWGRSGETDSVDRTERILQQLERRYKNGEAKVRPDLTTYSSVINSAAYFNGRNDDASREVALNVALRTYERIKLSDGISANSIVYGTLLKAVAKLTTVGPRRDELMNKFFVECCEAGQVDSFVMSQFRFGSSMEQYRSLVLDVCCLSDEQGGTLQSVQKRMPTSWTRNV